MTIGAGRGDGEGDLNLSGIHRQRRTRMGCVGGSRDCHDGLLVDWKSSHREARRGRAPWDYYQRWRMRNPGVVTRDGNADPAGRSRRADCHRARRQLATRHRRRLEG